MTNWVFDLLGVAYEVENAVTFDDACNGFAAMAGMTREQFDSDVLPFVNVGRCRSSEVDE